LRIVVSRVNTLVAAVAEVRELDWWVRLVLALALISAPPTASAQPTDRGWVSDAVIERGVLVDAGFSDEAVRAVLSARDRLVPFARNLHGVSVEIAVADPRKEPVLRLWTGYGLNQPFSNAATATLTLQAHAVRAAEVIFGGLADADKAAVGIVDLKGVELLGVQSGLVIAMIDLVPLLVDRPERIVGPLIGEADSAEAFVRREAGWTGFGDSEVPAALAPWPGRALEVLEARDVGVTHSWLAVLVGSFGPAFEGSVMMRWGPAASVLLEGPVARELEEHPVPIGTVSMLRGRRAVALALRVGRAAGDERPREVDDPRVGELPETLLPLLAVTPPGRATEAVRQRALARWTAFATQVLKRSAEQGFPEDPDRRLRAAAGVVQAAFDPLFFTEWMQWSMLEGLAGGGLDCLGASVLFSEGIRLLRLSDITAEVLGADSTGEVGHALVLLRTGDAELLWDPALARYDGVGRTRIYSSIERFASEVSYAPRPTSAASWSKPVPMSSDDVLRECRERVRMFEAVASDRESGPDGQPESPPAR
jgi:hypothetical protein